MASRGKYRSYTIKFKLEVLRYALNHSKAEASRRYGVHRKLVQTWCRQEDELLSTSSSRRRLPGAGLKARYADIDEELYQWLLEQRQSGHRVSGKRLRREALRLHAEKGDQLFKASSGWLKCWRRRHNISLRRRTTTAQKLPSDLEEKIVEFYHKIIRLCKRYNYNSNRIGNMDETAVYLDMPGEFTLQETGSKTVSIRTTGHDKDKVTVMLAALGDGTKIAPLVIFKGVRAPKNVPNGIVVAMSRNGWNNEEITKLWLEKCWGRLRNSFPRMLVWDSFKSHIMASVRERVNSHYNTHGRYPWGLYWTPSANGEVSLTAGGRR